jgi:hypothetical protein
MKRGSRLAAPGSRLETGGSKARRLEPSRKRIIAPESLYSLLPHDEAEAATASGEHPLASGDRTSYVTNHERRGTSDDGYLTGNQMRNGIVVVMTLLLTAAGATRAVAGTPDRPADRTDAQAQPEPGREPRTRDRSERRDQRRGREHASQSARDTRTFTVPPDTTLSVSNILGDITIAAAPGNTVRVEVVRSAVADTDDEARALLQSSPVIMEQRGNRVDIRAGGARSEGQLEVDISITAPASVAVDVRSIAGDITLTGLKGDARAESVSGSIIAHDLSALSSVRTMSGDVELTGCTSSNEMDASSVSGEVTGSTLKSRSCSFASVSGNLSLKAVACERANVRTISGELGYAGALDRGGRYEFRSHSGDVALVVDGRIGFEVNARSFSGRLTSDLPLKMNGATRTPRGGQHSLIGLYGDGSAAITVTTFSGSVNISTKP